MKLGHLSILIVVIIAVIVAAIITAFSLVTFASLDKAVENSLSSEADYIRSLITSIASSTKKTVLSTKNIFIANDWTYENLPWQPFASPPSTTPQPQYSNWTTAFEILSSTVVQNPEFYFFYMTGQSPVDQTIWSTVLAKQIDYTAPAASQKPSLVIPDLTDGTIITIDSTLPITSPSSLVHKIDAVRKYNVVTRPWFKDLIKTANGGEFSPASTAFTLNLQGYSVQISYHLPLVFDSATGVPTSYLSADVDTESIRRHLQSNANKQNTLILLDVRNTSSYSNGAIIATSKTEDDLAIVDSSTSLLWPATATPNPEINSIMQTVIGHYGGSVESLRNNERDAIITDAGDLVIAASHVIGEGNLHFMIVSAIPKEYYFGSTATTIAATIGGGVGFLILASGIILLIMFEQQKLVEGSKQSVRIAEAVARDLICYNTDQAHESITYALTSETLIDENGEKEEPNYTNKELIGALKAINENLKMYAPFLPEYILTGADDDSAEMSHIIIAIASQDPDDEDKNNNSSRMNNSNKSQEDSFNKNSGSMKRSSLRNNAASSNNNNDNNPYIPGDSMMTDFNNSTNSGNLNDSRNLNNSRNNKNNNSNNLDNHSQISHNSNTTLGAALHRNNMKAPVVSAVSRLRNRGDFVERMILCNLSLSKLATLLLPLSSSDSCPVQLKQVSRVVEILLDTASANNATIHSLVGDSLQVTVSAVTKTGHADVKALRFLTTCDMLLKKEFADWSKEDNQPSNQRLTSVEPDQMLITGAVVNSRGYCGVFGNDKRQQFLMFGFSDSNLMSSMHDLGVKKNMLLCCRTVEQNTNFEYEFRGAGVLDVVIRQKITTTTDEHNQLNSSNNNKHSNSNRQASSSILPQTAQGSTTSSMPPSSTVPVKTSATKMMTYPIYELVSRKNLKNANSDEWLYVVGAGSMRAGNPNNNTNGVGNQLMTEVNDTLSKATLELVKNNYNGARQLLKETEEKDPSACELAAFKQIEASIFASTTTTNHNNSSTGGSGQQQQNQDLNSGGNVHTNSFKN